MKALLMNGPVAQTRYRLAERVLDSKAHTFVLRSTVENFGERLLDASDTIVWSATERTWFARLPSRKP